MCLTVLITLRVAYIMYKSRWADRSARECRNRIMAGAVGIKHRKSRPLHLRPRLGIAGIAGSAFTMIGSTSPTAGQLYIVDTFLVVVFARGEPVGHHLPRPSRISQAQSTMSSSCRDRWPRF